jgi:putative transposase
VLGIYISEKRNMLIAEKFIRSLVENYGKHIVYTDGGTWYDEACNVLRLKHYLYSSFFGFFDCGDGNDSIVFNSYS